MKYKIQTQMLIHPKNYNKTKNVFGWGDLKHSKDDGKTYQANIYDTKKDAQEKLDEIVAEFNENENMYRIVSENVNENINIYTNMKTKTNYDNQKLFILNTCPIDELVEGFVRDVVIAYRLNHISLIKALEHFSKRDIEDYFEMKTNLDNALWEFIESD
jgi:hypothetical protein